MGGGGCGERTPRPCGLLLWKTLSGAGWMPRTGWSGYVWSTHLPHLRTRTGRMSAPYVIGCAFAKHIQVFSRAQVMDTPCAHTSQINVSSDVCAGVWLSAASINVPTELAAHIGPAGRISHNIMHIGAEEIYTA